MKRRAFLRLLTLPAGVMLLRPAIGNVSHDRVLLLVELKGGNDGLNTVIPYADQRYYALRPRIAIARDDIVQLDERRGLHPALGPLEPLWRQRELAIVEGVGYPDPSLSHFRSMDIWATGSGSALVLDQGWIARLWQGHEAESGMAGIAIGRDAGPLAGNHRALVMNDPERFLRQARSLRTTPAVTGNPTLDHVVGLQQGVARSARSLAADLEGGQVDTEDFPRTRFGRQLGFAAQLVSAGVRTPVIKVSHGSFDTHSNQPEQHRRLLTELAEGLEAFRRALLRSGDWGRVLVMTYSEFGRRPAENGSRGTDHGTAAPQLVLGSAVRGGIYGAAASLSNLDVGNLRFTTDYRRLYSTVARWWGVPWDPALAGHPALPLLKS